MENEKPWTLEEIRELGFESFGEMGFVNRINCLAQSEYEAIIIDKNTRVVYQRNLDFEWAGGNLYDPIGQVSQKILETPETLDSRIKIRENFWEEVRYCRFSH